MNKNVHLTVGLIALLLAFLSLYDLFRLHVYDGITPMLTTKGILVDKVDPGSPADRAGMQTGDRVLGISSTLISNPFSVGTMLKQLTETDVPYLVERSGQVHTFMVQLETKRNIRLFHILTGMLLIVFSMLGLIVFLNNPLGAESRVFYYLSLALLLLFTCLLRSHSYSLGNLVIRSVGELSYLLLPVLFLHFFLLYPHRSTLVGTGSNRAVMLYLVPIFLAVCELTGFYIQGRPLLNFNWRWLLYMIYSLLSLAALRYSQKKAPPGERTGLMMLYGISMFIFILVAIPFGISRSHLEIAAFFSIPLMVMPIYLSYRIYRFGFFNIKILLKKSLLYSFILLLLSVLYALIIFLINTTLNRFSLTDPYLYSMGLAITIVFLFNPLHDFFRAQLEDIFLQKERQRKRNIAAEAEELLNSTDREQLEERILNLLSASVPGRFALLIHTEQQHFRELKSERVVRVTEDLPHSRFFLLENTTDSQFFHYYQQGFRLAFPFRKLGPLRAILFARSVLFDEELETVRSMLLHFVTAYENTRLIDRLSRQLELERDVKIAGYIQQSLIPSHHPEGPSFQAYGVSQPSKVVGGDFFDYVELPDNRGTGILVGDVAGKSIPAAMMMVAAKETIGSQAMVCREPDEAMSRASQLLYQKSGANMFVAACYCVLNPETRELNVVNAGMPAPVLVRKGKVIPMPRQSPRFPLGLVSSVQYRKHAMILEQDDVVVLLTDGVTEPLEQELESVIQSCPFGDAKLFTQELLKHLRQNSGNILEDDATIVSLMMKPF